MGLDFIRNHGGVRLMPGKSRYHCMALEALKNHFRDMIRVFGLADETEQGHVLNDLREMEKELNRRGCDWKVKVI